ncbi:MAG: DNA polymerase I [Nitrospinota bacterium]
MAERLFLIDGSSYIFRAYYAIRQPLSTSKGLSTAAVFGFANMLLKVLREKTPRFLAIAFDRREPTLRHQRYPEYKANRAATPEDLAEQLPYIHRLVDAMQIPRLSEPGYEADDLMGTLARKARQRGFEVILVAGDKDLMQLVAEGVLMWDPMKDLVIDAGEVEKKFGVPPGKVVEVQALMGDSTDNIPGVPGIGEKSASQLIQQYGSLENLLAHASEISRPRQREALLQHADLARLSRELCTLITDAPVEFTPERYRWERADGAALEALFQELEFSRLLDQVHVVAGGEAAPGAAPGRLEVRAEGRDYVSVTDRRAFAKLLSELERAGRFAVDVETTHFDPSRAEVVGLSFSARPGRARYVPIGHVGLGTKGQLPAGEVLGGLRPLLESPQLAKVGQNIKYDLVVLASCGVRLRGVTFDTMVASYLVDPGRRSHSLDALAGEYLGVKPVSYQEVAGTGAKQKPFSEVPLEVACDYSCEDADLTLRLADLLGKELEDAGLNGLFDEVEVPLIPLLAGMERKGVGLNGELLRRMSADLEGRMEGMTARIHELAGEPFNVNSPVQLREILFKKLKLPVISRTKTGPSTGMDVLEKLAAQHPLPAEILAYRQLAKLKSTYVDTLPGLVNPRTGRIHASFNQTVAATGRLSSSEPNLQNIPIRTELGRQIRRAFVPAPGRLFLSADYSQVELRVLAHFTEDPSLVRAFREGEDIHRRTASEVFGAEPDAVTEEMRRMAKAVNFGVLYGLSAFGLSFGMNIPMEEARAFIEAYFARYPKVAAFIEGTLARAREEGLVRTLLGRRRFLPDLKSKNANARSAAERTAVNTVIQGSAADIMKLAMLRIDRKIHESSLPADLLIQVHDELVFEVDKGAEKKAADLVREEMERACCLKVPLSVEVSVGRSWGDLH